MVKTSEAQKKNVERFNAILNQTLGATVSPRVRNYSVPVQSDVGLTKEASRFQQNSRETKALLKELTKERTSSKTKNASSNGLKKDVTTNLKEIDNTKDYQAALKKLIGEGKSPDRALLEMALGKPSWFKRNVVNRTGNLLGRAGDLASRGMYALSEGALQMTQALDQGQQPWEVFDDLAHGAGQGLWGTKKTGFGDFVNYMNDPDVERHRTGWGEAFLWTNLGAPFMALNEGNKKLREKYGRDNLASHIFNVAAGASGELFLDPANWIGVGLATSTSDAVRASSKIDDVVRAFRSAENVADPITKAERKAARAWLKTSEGITYQRNSWYMKIAQDQVDNSELLSRLSNRPGGYKTATGARAGGSRTPAQVIAESMADVMDNGILTPEGTSRSVNNHIIREASAANAGSVAYEMATKTFEKNYEKILNDAMELDSKAYQKLVNSGDPLWEAFEEYIDGNLHKLADETSGYTRHQLLEEAHRAAIDKVVTPEINKVMDNIRGEITAGMYNSPAIRVGNTKVEIRPLGEAYDKFRTKTGFNRIVNPLSLDSQISQAGTQMVRKARARSAERFHKFLYGYKDAKGNVFRGAREVAGQYDAAARTQIRQFINNDLTGMALPGNHLDDGIQFVRDELKEIYNLEIASGARSVDSKFVKNYTPVEWKEALLDRTNINHKRKVFTEQRKLDIANTGNVISDVDIALQAKLKPVEDIFEALYVRRLKAEHQIARAEVTEAFFRNLGVSGKNVSPTLARGQGWEKIASLGSNGKVREMLTRDGKHTYKINENLRKFIQKSGEDLYLPKDVAEAFYNFQRLADTQNLEELGDFMKIFDKVLRNFKASATMPYPGFHVKNMVGDIFVGWMDGVRVGDYDRFFKVAAANNETLPTVAKSKTTYFQLGNGNQLDYHVMNRLYKQNAASGGFSTMDTSPSARTAVGRRVNKATNRTGEFMRNLSEGREDLGRKVHFVHAIEDELNVRKLRNVKLDEAFWDTPTGKKVIDNATFRVDKWKFDYGALTATERTIMRRVMPFYTFMRKSLPAMLEGFLMNPDMLGKQHRLFSSQDGELGPQFYPWERELGFASWGNTIIPKSIFPIDTMQDLLNDPTNPGATSKVFVDQLNPLLKILYELGTNHNSFTGRDLFKEQDRTTENQFNYALRNILPPVGTIEDLVTKGKLSDRMVLGLGIKSYGEETRLRNLQYGFGSTQKRINQASERLLEPLGYRMFVSTRNSGTSIVVKEIDGKELYRGDLQGALTVVQNILGTVRANN